MTAAFLKGKYRIRLTVIAFAALEELFFKENLA